MSQVEQLRRLRRESPKAYIEEVYVIAKLNWQASELLGEEPDPACENVFKAYEKKEEWLNNLIEINRKEVEEVVKIMDQFAVTSVDDAYKLYDRGLRT